MRIIAVILCGWSLMLSLSVNAQSDATHHIQSDAYEGLRTLSVHLPKNFKPTDTLPVIYVFDAQWAPYYKLITSQLDYLIEIKAFPPAVVVGVHAENRSFELTPEPIHDDWKVPSLGGARQLESHLNDEVFPFIKSQYHTNSFRIGLGHSLGGTFVLNSLVDAPKLFGACIAISPNLQLDEGSIMKKLMDKRTELFQENRFVYTSMGSEGDVDQLFFPFLEQLNANFEKGKSSSFYWYYNVYKTFDHATTPMATIHNALLELGRLWKPSKGQMEAFSKAEDPIAKFQGFYAHWSQWQGVNVLPSQGDYFGFGDVLETQKQHQAAIALYKIAAKSFPESSEFQDKLGLQLVALNALEDAQLAFKKALEILEIEKASFEYPGSYDYYKSLYTKHIEKANGSKP